LLLLPVKATEDDVGVVADTKFEVPAVLARRLCCFGNKDFGNCPPTNACEVYGSTRPKTMRRGIDISRVILELPAMGS